MIDPTQNIVKILRQHARGFQKPIVGSTRLSDLEIDLLDLPLLILDLEDAFHVCIRHEEYERIGTVRELAACVVTNVQKSVREARQLALAPRVKRNWMSTGAEQRG